MGVGLPAMPGLESENPDPYVKTDDRNIEFRVTLKPDEEKVLTYRVRYDWK